MGGRKREGGRTAVAGSPSIGGVMAAADAIEALARSPGSPSGIAAKLACTASTSHSVISTASSLVCFRFVVSIK